MDLKAVRAARPATQKTQSPGALSPAPTLSAAGRKVGNEAMGVAMRHLRNSCDRIGILSADPLLTNNLNILVEASQLAHLFVGPSCGHGAHVANCPAWRF